jgi:DNA-binding response OmpR family regulator
MSVSTPRPLDGLTILVIDDHRDTVDVFREYLTSVGATVVGADSARSGLMFAETHLLDAVLVDLRLPGEDGAWFLRHLRTSRMPGAATVPVFALSGERHDLPADPASGFAGYFLKPIELDALVARLKSLPRRSR